MTDWTGQQLGNYSVLCLLETGNVIDRYLGSDVSSQKEVALSVLAEPADEAGVFRFLRNASIVRRLVHPHIASVLDAGAQEMTPFLVQEHFPSSRQSHPFPLPISTVVLYVAQLAEAFDYAHSGGYLHSYTAPETILIGSQGEALLSGFGLRLLEISRPSRNRASWNPLVLPAYFSPEQIVGEPLEASGDQYSLAVVVYEWLCGEPPFQGATPLEIALQHIQAPPPSLREREPAISQELEQVVKKALTKAPKERFPSVNAFSAALAEAVAAY